MLHFLTDEGKAILDEWRKSLDAQFLLESYLKEIKENLAKNHLKPHAKDEAD